MRDETSPDQPMTMDTYLVALSELSTASKCHVECRDATDTAKKWEASAMSRLETAQKTVAAHQKALKPLLGPTPRPRKAKPAVAPAQPETKGDEA